MKTTIYRLVCLMLVCAPVAVSAQSNIRSAFDAIAKCPEAKITENMTLDKDPNTKVKTGQSEIYDFVLPAGKIKLVEKVLEAFDKDNDMAYKVGRGSVAKKRDKIALAVGDGTGEGVNIAQPGCEYTYALFLAPQSEDQSGNYRYAYAISYKEDGEKIEGRLVVTYATTLKYRQEKAGEKQMKVLRGFTADDNNTNEWFNLVMEDLIRIQSIENPRYRTKKATGVYNRICSLSQYPNVTASQIEVIREVLKSMVGDSKYSEPMLNKLLNQSLVEIRKNK